MWLMLTARLGFSCARAFAATASDTLPTTGTVVGTYTWSATYSGDDNNASAVDQGTTAEQTVVSPARRITSSSMLGPMVSSRPYGKPVSRPNGSVSRISSARN